MIRLKNQAQLDKIRQSCRLLSALFEDLVPRVREGVSTGELDSLAHDFIVARGGKPAFLGYQGYPGSLCVSVNEEVIHGIPGRRRLVAGDIVGLDCGIDLDGHFSDAAITLPVGPVSDDARRLMQVTRECLDRAIAAAKPGGRIHDISRAVYGHATAQGFGVVRSYCGHGVGFSLHEDPQIPNYVSPGPNPRLVPGMVIAIEPMINLGTGDVRVLDDDWTVVTLDRKPSAHYEHTIAVLADGIEVLTSWHFPGN
ncbi:MAG TPA: type I methionyl aminopeptidase [Rectinemataceae bacterium]|nr:type I methionyl aminopeptidase [Rectinemataceae bacterium]